MKNNERYMEKR